MAKQRLFSAGDLQKIKTQLEDKRSELATQCHDDALAIYQNVPTFDAAVTLRDHAQMLVSVCNRLGNIDMSIEYAALKGPQQLHFSLADCGLE